MANPAQKMITKPYESAQSRRPAPANPHPANPHPANPHPANPHPASHQPHPHHEPRISGNNAELRNCAAIYPTNP
jgi:hypothetical protein